MSESAPKRSHRSDLSPAVCSVGFLAQKMDPPDRQVSIPSKPIVVMVRRKRLVSLGRVDLPLCSNGLFLRNQLAVPFLCFLWVPQLLSN